MTNFKYLNKPQRYQHDLTIERAINTEIAFQLKRIADILENKSKGN